MENKPKTVCFDCRNCYRRKGEIYCIASPIPPSWSPVTGEDESRQRFYFCSMVNQQGDCPLIDRGKPLGFRSSLLGPPARPA